MSSRHTQCLVAACVLIAPVAPALAAPFNVLAGVTDTAPKTLAPGNGATETGTVAATGILSIGGSTVAVTVNGGNGTRTAVINNSGTIRQTGSGRAVRANSNPVVLNINNAAGAVLSAVGDDTVQVSSGAAGSTFTLSNSGMVMSTNSRAINLRDIGGSNTINNNAGGVLRSTGNDAVRPGVNGIINNFGLIEAVPALENIAGGGTQASGNDGIQADPDGTAVVTGVTVNNKTGATIAGRHGITGSATTSAAFTITVVNDVGAAITAVNGSGINIDNNGARLGNATVTNSGSIIGNYDSAKYNTGDGDGVDVDGLVTLVNNGIIRGTGANGLGSDGGGNNPEGVSVGGGSITNNAGAEITGQETTGSGRKGHGVLVDNSSGGAAFSATSVSNAGLIRGFDSYAIRFIGVFADTITNSAGGVIRGGGNAVEGAAIQTGDGADVLTNRGSIIGDNGLAIDLEAGDDTLHVFSGSPSIVGDVSGGTGTNSLDFDTGASFSYAGALANFAAVEIKSGAVSLSGASTYTGSTTVTAGSLFANNASGSATGTGVVTVKSGATLGGTGRVASVVTQAGGTIAPGIAAGTLSITNSLGITGGSKFQFELGAVSDRLDVGGALSFTGGGAAVIDIVDNGIVPGTDYTLISFGSSSGVTSASLVLGAIPAGIQASLDVTAGAVVLRTVAPVSVTGRFTNPSVTGASTDTTPVAEGASGVFAFTSRFCNASPQNVANAFSRTRELSAGKSLISRTRAAPTGAPGGVGSEQDFPRSMGNADGLLSSGECVDVLYRIGLDTRTNFSFRVDLLGNVIP